MEISSFFDRGIRADDASFLDRLSHAANEISDYLGTGGPMSFLIVVLVIATVLIGLGLAVSFFSSAKKGEENRVTKLEGLLGRFERTERTLNEFRAEALRNLELSRTELEYLRSDFETIRELLQEQLGRGIREPDLDHSLVVRQGRERRASREGITPFEPSPVVVPPPRDEPPSEPTVETIAPPAAESLTSRLRKTRFSFFEKFRSIFASKPKLDEEAVEELEAILVSSDLGIKTAGELLAELKEDVRNGAEVNEGGLAALLKRKLLAILEQGTPRAPITAPRRRDDGPVVILVVGVNGVGKTTTIAKLAHAWKNQGSSVLLVAADTFRAAAVEQLHEWGRRLGIPVVSGAADAKPQTVVFDAMVRAKQDPIDVVLIDTAGRLHNKQNLMDELEGIGNSIQRHLPSAPDEVLLVLDGSTGQNAVVQAREFNEATKLTGIVITKLDGTAKGGVVVGIKGELGVPIRYIGVGEGQEDLRPFVPRDFVEALFDTSDTGLSAEPSANAEVRRRRRADG